MDFPLVPQFLHVQNQSAGIPGSAERQDIRGSVVNRVLSLLGWSRDLGKGRLKQNLS